MSLIFDEFGRPFVILKDQQQQARLRGIEAQKANILAARSVSAVLRSSLGPKGLNKTNIPPRFSFFHVHTLHFDGFIRHGQNACGPRWSGYYYQRWCYHFAENGCGAPNCQIDGRFKVCVCVSKIEINSFCFCSNSLMSTLPLYHPPFYILYLMYIYIVDPRTTKLEMVLLVSLC